jgi:8-oxo-dGTP pyrophosphatase MutT (NUDIX family)
VGKWGLPGGKLKPREKPRAALRREIEEELGLKVADLARIGDWWHRDKSHRVFGCDVPRATQWFDRVEIVAIAWLDYREIVRLWMTGELRTGFELAAVTDYRKRFPAAAERVVASRTNLRDVVARRRRPRG